MESTWLKVGDVLPQSGQEVLTYYYDEPFELEQFEVFTYFKKGDKVYFEEVNNRDMLGQILGKYARTLEEDGFYIYDSVDGINNKWRKHADIITHWQPLVRPL